MKFRHIEPFDPTKLTPEQWRMWQRGEIPVTSINASQLPLFMRDAPHSGSATSRDAAEKIKPHLPQLEMRVFLYLLARADGATAQEIEEGTGLGGSTVRPRLVELRARELVADSGTTRKTRSGRSATVWKIK